MTPASLSHSSFPAARGTELRASALSPEALGTQAIEASADLVQVNAQWAKHEGRIIRLFGVELFDTTLECAAGWLIERAWYGKQVHVAFANAHCINVMYRDQVYQWAFTHADRIFVDGSGMAIAARASGMKLTENVNGTDLFPVLCATAAKFNTGLFLFGGQAGVAAQAAEKMTARIPGLRISGTRHGYLQTSDEEAELIETINASGARIVLVGMGVPGQEIWIARNRHRLSARVIMGVGGLFDYYSGRIPRAPQLLRRAGLEWTWRLAMEPRRLAGRYIHGNCEFLARLVCFKMLAPIEFGPRRI